MKVHTDPNTPLGTRHELTQEEFDAGIDAVLIVGTGITGVITLRDGTTYDISPYHVACKSEHVAQLQREIHKRYHAVGQFLEVPLPPE